MSKHLLEEYLDRSVCIHFNESHSSKLQTEEGILLDCSSAGVLLEHEKLNEVFIPFTAIRLIQMKPKPSFWQRFTGT